jgi:hypothetical protein
MPAVEEADAEEWQIGKSNPIATGKEAAFVAGRAGSGMRSAAASRLAPPMTTAQPERSDSRLDLSRFMIAS